MRVGTLPGRKVLVTVAAAALASTGLAACGSGSGGGNSNTVTIWSSIDQPVQDGLKKKLVSELKADNSKITIKWQKVENINQLIITKIQAGDTPDIALVPQPGVVSQMKSLGAVKPLDGVVSKDELSSYLPGAADFSKFDGKTYGLIVSMNIKGLVFYNKPWFTQKGYTAPTDMAGLVTLADKIKSDGTAPWCFGIESDTATGWPATDWIENILAKQSGADVYKDWVTHKVKFDSDDVKKAFDTFDQLLLTDGNTYGGSKAIVSTNFANTGNPMFQSPPKCGLWEQGSFAPSFLPKSVLANQDQNIGVFGLPPESAGGDNPVELGGDSMTMLNDTANVKKVVKLLAATEIGEDAAGSSSFISPHKDFDASKYPNELTRDMVKVATGATTTVFDASDQMPAAVGSGSFWKQVTAWIAGQTTEDKMLKAIDDSWPAS
ncbi:carbohydrate ABC transporter substrate-binding protein [Nocardioides mangrovicus]|uniref:Carbohydrate ABC transporter substrate-binding protein n=1 Tax=Nocardioides mangrovicus TaxID=2478913 RepID=A0A3L8P6C6_9ACTN|nr:ABC transporter substrate-binding protein [Nocardioides mangrovicus]RLV50781.1 carbohydrate ABC transporter substrate-binding protein [Nocardioides mangrovicus]